MRPREFRRLSAEPFDLLVVGGGIYGAWTAYDAALRGLRVALVERDDWASATSSASSKLVHGGLRYLEQAEFRLVHKTLDERRRLVRLGPHRVRPLRFVLPSYAGDRVGRWRLGLGLWLYDRLAGKQQPVAAHETLGRAEMVRRYGLLEPEGLRGGFVFGDCGTDDARLTLEIVDGADAAGAVTVNRAPARALLLDGSRVVGARVADGDGGPAVEVRAKVTVDTTGPCVGHLLRAASPDRPLGTRLTKGVHLVMPALSVPEAFLLLSRADRRVVFLIPWYGRTLLGTTDTDHSEEALRVAVDDADVNYLLARANAALRGSPWGRSDVIASFAGVRTLPRSDETLPSAVSREWHLGEPLPGLLTSLGGKLTSARADAARIVSRVLALLARPAGPSPTEERPLPWSWSGRDAGWPAEARRRARAAGLDAAAADCCLERHGTRIDAVLEHVRREPTLARRIVPDAPFCLAEAVQAVEAEQAGTLEDILRRRMPLVLISAVGRVELVRAAQSVGEALGWDAARRHSTVEEFAAVLDRTRGPNPRTGPGDRAKDGAGP